jgi:fructokinase
MMERLFGAIEAGGTKFICAVGTGPDDLDTRRFSTTTPEETIAKSVDFFKRQTSAKELSAIGIASFGPVDPDKSSSTYGYITSTPKPGWANTNFVGMMKDALDTPIRFDSDTNGAALGEHRWGAGKGLSDFIYLTIGTGFGGGAIANGELVHGMMHPEMGHIHIPKRADDNYEGSCPFHGNRCIEGLASGPAIEGRWGRRGASIESGHEAWELEAHYISLALVNYICTFSPQRLVLGGGVMAQQQLFPMIREKVTAILNGYIRSPRILEKIDEYIVPPAFGNRAGIVGAVALAMDAASGNDASAIQQAFPL